MPPLVIRATLCSTLSAQLIQDEWAKHGTCMAVSPTWPRFRVSRSPSAGWRVRGGQSPIPADAVRVTVSRDGWLDESWLCLDRRLRYARGRPRSDGATDAARVQIWRGGH